MVSSTGGSRATRACPRQQRELRIAGGPACMGACRKIGTNPSKGAARSAEGLPRREPSCPGNLGRRREHLHGDVQVRADDNARRSRESRDGEQLNDERPERACRLDLIKTEPNRETPPHGGTHQLLVSGWRKPGRMPGEHVAAGAAAVRADGTRDGPSERRERQVGVLDELGTVWRSRGGSRCRASLHGDSNTPDPESAASTSSARSTHAGQGSPAGVRGRGWYRDGSEKLHTKRKAVTGAKAQTCHPSRWCRGLLWGVPIPERISALAGRPAGGPSCESDVLVMMPRAAGTRLSIVTVRCWTRVNEAARLVREGCEGRFCVGCCGLSRACHGLLAMD